MQQFSRIISQLFGRLIISTTEHLLPEPSMQQTEYEYSVIIINIWKKYNFSFILDWSPHKHVINNRVNFTNTSNLFRYSFTFFATQFFICTHPRHIELEAFNSCRVLYVSRRTEGLQRNLIKSFINCWSITRTLTMSIYCESCRIIILNTWLTSGEWTVWETERETKI